MAKPKLPTTLRIGHLTYTVKADRKNTDKDGLLGVSFGDTQEILLNTELPPDTAAATLLHEVLHQCLYVAGQRIPDKIEEPIVRAMAGPLLAALRDNQDLTAYLLP